MIEFVNKTHFDWITSNGNQTTTPNIAISNQRNRSKIRAVNQKYKLSFEEQKKKLDEQMN